MISLKNILTEIESEKLQVYVDMDGVLVDFVKGYTNVMGEPPGPPLHGQARQKFWRDLRAGMWKKGMSENDFWSGLPWMSDGKALWSYLKPHDPIILSAPSVYPQSVTGKRDWIRKNIGSVFSIFEYDKSKWAKPNHVLIDDRRDFIDKWVAAGGIGILHKNTPQTIKRLKELGI